MWEIMFYRPQNEKIEKITDACPRAGSCKGTARTNSHIHATEILSQEFF
jgi:hypothetical protein